MVYPHLDCRVGCQLIALSPSGTSTQTGSSRRSKARTPPCKVLKNVSRSLPPFINGRLLPRTGNERWHCKPRTVASFRIHSQKVWLSSHSTETSKVTGSSNWNAGLNRQSFERDSRTEL